MTDLLPMDEELENRLSRAAFRAGEDNSEVQRKATQELAKRTKKMESVEAGKNDKKIIEEWESGQVPPPNVPTPEKKKWFRFWE